MFMSYFLGILFAFSAFTQNISSKFIFIGTLFVAA